MHRILPLLVFALSLPNLALAASPVRFDLTGAPNRSDAVTVAWQTLGVNRPDQAQASNGDLAVTVQASGSELQGFLHKAGLVTGATLANDGARCQAGAIEVTLTGLSAGQHSIATYHNLPQGEAAELQVSAGDQSVRVTPSIGVQHDHHMATAYLQITANGEPVTLRIASESGGPVVLNAIEIDAADPARRAQAPLPANQYWHADGDNGSVDLAWAAVEGAQSYQVFVAQGSTKEEAASKLSSAQPMLRTNRPSASTPIVSNDSLLAYAWRVDTTHADGSVVSGEVWTFGVRTLAFPGAEGYGRFARGGRGGRVIKVTNLNDSGPGSLRAAVEATGPRTVVFDVSGRIVLQSRLIIRRANSRLTIAGQTAPGKGICISNYNLGGFGGRDLILRHIRVRPGDTSGKTLDGMGLAACDNAIVDHCSISWTQDESFSSRGARNITLQRTLISEALNIAGHKKYGKGTAHGYAASIGGDIGSFHHNLLAHCAGRNWSLAGGIDAANQHRGRLDIRNNVVYNWDYRTTDGGAKEVQFVANYYKPGPATRLLTYLNPDYENPSFGPQQYYIEGNLTEGVYPPEGPTGPLAGVKVRGTQPWPVRQDHPFFPHDVQTQTAERAYRNVLRDVGCNYSGLDEHDQRVLKEVRQGTTTYTGSISGKPGLPDSQTDVGGWEDYPNEHRAADWDPDSDGIPSNWETAHGLNPSDPTDGPCDPDGDGFTNLEDYLNELAAK